MKILLSMVIGFGFLVGQTSAVEIGYKYVGMERPQVAPIVGMYIDDFDRDVFSMEPEKELGAKDNLLSVVLNYYVYMRAGNQKELVKLYSPEIGRLISTRYPDDLSVSSEAAKLKAVILKKVLYWGDYRFALVEHKANDDLKGATYEWIHTLSCISDRCQFVASGDGMRLASLIMRISKAPNKFSVYPEPSKGRHKLVLTPGLDTDALKLQTYPVELFFKKAQSNDFSGISKLFSDLRNSIGNDDGEITKSGAFFTNGNPKSYRVASLNSAVVSSYTDFAFLMWVRHQPGLKVSDVFLLDNDSALVLARASSGALLSLIAAKGNAGWKFETSPMENSVWQLSLERPFLTAYMKMR